MADSPTSSIVNGFIRIDEYDPPGRTPEDWTSYTHPRGWLYFRHNEHRLVTDEDIRNPDVYTDLSKPRAELHPFGNFPARCEVHVMGSNISGRRMTILVDHDQCIATPDDGVESQSSFVTKTRCTVCSYI